MKFIANKLNGKYIRIKPINIPWVKAAVAYASGNTELFDFCLEQDIPLTFWGRVDYSVPVSTLILKKFLNKKSPNFVCKLVEKFHPKIIWWGEFGAYIGSANLTQNGWYDNIEAGLFLTHEELIENGLVDELDNFFYQLDKRSNPLTDELYNKLCEIQEEQKALNKEKAKLKSKFDNILNIPRNDSSQRNRDDFLREWYQTLTDIRAIAARVSTDEYRPQWISSDVASGVQVDQFLHAHYYVNVMEGNRSRHEEWFEENKVNPEAALLKAMKWWKTLKQDPCNESVMINDWAPFLAEKMSKDNILQLNESDFEGLCLRVNAIREHARQTSKKVLGLPKDTPPMTIDERARIFGRWLFNQHSEHGRSPLEVIYFILYEGSDDDLPVRLWKATNDEEWNIPHFGISSLGEMVGWALPDKFPPRNGRTSKALKSLGYDVGIHV